MARMSKERIESEKQKLLERKKVIEAALKKNVAKERKITRKEETTTGMTFWRFITSHRPDLYAEIVKSNEFSDYLKTDYQRGLFGLNSLPPCETDAGKSQDRAYLDVPFGEKEAVKKLGSKWDGSARRWYVPEDLELNAFSAWLPGMQGQIGTFEMPEDSEELQIDDKA